MNPSSSVEIPEYVPYFNIEKVIYAYYTAGGQGDDVCPWLAPGSLLDSLYGLCSLIRETSTSADGTAEADSLLGLDNNILLRPFNGLYLRSWYHHYLINHTNEWLNKERGDMPDEEYPYRLDNEMSEKELIEIFTPSSAYLESLSKPVLHERDYFTTANPSPQKGAAEVVVAGGTIQDLTKAIHLQDIKEKDADSGNSYYEAIYNRYGVSPKSLGVMRPVPCAKPTRQVLS